MRAGNFGSQGDLMYDPTWLGGLHVSADGRTCSPSEILHDRVGNKGGDVAVITSYEDSRGSISGISMARISRETRCVHSEEIE